MNYFSPPVFYYFHKTEYKSSAHAFVECIALISLKKRKRINFGLLLVIFGTHTFKKKFIVDSMDIKGHEEVNVIILNS